jgi:hypothetical protein
MGRRTNSVLHSAPFGPYQALQRCSPTRGMTDIEKVGYFLCRNSNINLHVFELACQVSATPGDEPSAYSHDKGDDEVVAAWAVEGRGFW